MRAIDNNGAEIIGIDISEVSVAEAQRRMQCSSSGNYMFFCVMDAENTAFIDEAFNTIICSGVLHHMDLNKAYPEIRRVLNNRNGAAICIEPLDYNPVFKLYRKLTPEGRTSWESEHILAKTTINMSQKYFSRVDLKFFHLTTLLAQMRGQGPGARTGPRPS